MLLHCNERQCKSGIFIKPEAQWHIQCHRSVNRIVLSTRLVKAAAVLEVDILGQVAILRTVGRRRLRIHILEIRRKVIVINERLSILLLDHGLLTRLLAGIRSQGTLDFQEFTCLLINLLLTNLNTDLLDESVSRAIHIADRCLCHPRRRCDD